MFFVSTTFSENGSLASVVVDKCLSHGIRNIELGSNHCYERNILEKIQAHQGRWLVHNYFPVPEDGFIINIASSDESIRRKSVDHIKNSIIFCNRIEGGLYTFHPGFLADPVAPITSKRNYDFVFPGHFAGGVQGAFDRMLSSLETIISFAHGENVRIALESEGSVSKPDQLLMQQPEEFDRLYSQFTYEDIGINLNVGHLNLASITFSFDKDQFIGEYGDKFCAMELSHNDGTADQHLPLQQNGWYFKYILDKKYRDIPKILEFRNTSVKTIIKNLESIENQMSNVLRWNHA